MYFIQFRLQFFLLILTFYTRNSDYQSHAIASMGARRGGGARIGHLPPPQKKSSLAILGAFLLLFLHMWAFFGYVFLIFGGLFTMWGPFCYFLLHGEGLFWGLPPPPPTKISAGTHDCKECSRAYSS